MASILIGVPDFSDQQLIFNETETKEILCFFFKHDVAAINALPSIGNNARRLAQTALVAALEGTYAMGFIHKTFLSLGGPAKASVAKWARKLAKDLAGHAWRHLKHTDLKDAQVYDAIRDRVTVALRSRLTMIVQGVDTSMHLRGRFNYYATVPTRLRSA